MLASVRALLAGIIDYAGLFPPARLPLDQALRNYARYRRQPESWMLGRFICPAARLAELAPFADEVFPPGLPLPLVVLGKAGTSWAQLSVDLQADRLAIQDFASGFAGRVAVEGYECGLPDGGLPADFSLANLAAPSSASTFFEISIGANWRSGIAEFVSLIKGVNQERRASDGRSRREPDVTSTCGLKVRCGGLAASAFPTAEQVAFVMVQCRDAAVPLKFTARLHHPLRHFDPQFNVKAHGFLNLFGAGVLAYGLGLKDEQVLPIIEEENSDNFHFEAERFSWRDLAVDNASITTGRRLVTSFGSCSWEEPVADLRGMGLL